MRAEVSRWSGRIIGGIGVLMWTLAMVAQTFVEPIEDTATVESIALVTLVVINVLAYAAGIRSERNGGTATLLAGAVFSLFAIITAGHNHWLAALVSGGPFIAAGTLFLVAAQADDQVTAITTT